MKRKFSTKVIVLFLIFQLIFFIITMPFIVFYGPFDNVKRIVVGSSMNSFRHQYIAKIFLSQEEINKILKQDDIEVFNQKNIKIIESNIRKKDMKAKNIERYNISSDRFKGYVIIVNNPFTIKVGYSTKLGEKGEITSKIAQNYGAAAAINGGGFAYKSKNKTWIGTGGNPVGFLITDGNVKFQKVNNNDEKLDVMAITKEGVLLVGKHSLNDMKRMNVKEAITFGPPLVVDGKGTIKSGNGGWGIAPRTAIGQRKDGSIIFLVIDGRQPPFSYGATLKDVQNIMIKYDAYNATNLDGGASATMYYNNKVINNPSSPLGERAVPSIIYVKN
ncbi:phosphodiester glycosidase family protein [Haloimpatiens sp. FM7330]|uniref:phosphodiester glycosidase family protein n=1 Tax=Haloimpatiens sp. FM7330 TaxID=3298610 RepID=UPI00362A8B56